MGLVEILNRRMKLYLHYALEKASLVLVQKLEYGERKITILGMEILVKW